MNDCSQHHICPKNPSRSPEEFQNAVNPCILVLASSEIIDVYIMHSKIKCSSESPYVTDFDHSSWQ